LFEAVRCVVRTQWLELNMNIFNFLLSECQIDCIVMDRVSDIDDSVCVKAPADGDGTDGGYFWSEVAASKYPANNPV